MAKRQHTPEPEVGAFESLDLMAAVEKWLTKRQSLQDEIAAIDAELRRVYERIGGDRPARVEAPPTAPEPSPAAVEASSTRVKSSLQRAKREREAVTVQPERRSLADDIEAVVAVVRAGHHQPKDIYAQMGNRPPDMVKRALYRALKMGRLRQTGQTNSTRYAVPEPPPGPRSAGRTVVSDGVEFESVWSGRRDEPSLIGDRPGQRSSLANA